MMKNAAHIRTVPFTKSQIVALTAKFPTPVYIYDEAGIEESAKSLIDAFSWNKGFKEYFAVKATPNPSVLKILKRLGCGADASTLAELHLAEQAGLKKSEIVFTSNDTPIKDMQEALRRNVIVNLDDITDIAFIEKYARIPNTIGLRYNPGAARSGGNAIIGKPTEAKYGLTKKQLLEAYAILKKKGVTHFGLHTMVISNELKPTYFVETAQMMFELIVEIYQKLGIRIEFVNLGGGIGIPYMPGEKDVDLNAISVRVKKLYETIIVKNNLHPLKIFMECGRLVTGPHGYLVSKVIHMKDTYRTYVGLDASMANLMRPGMYGAYHHISVLGKEKRPTTYTYDVVGSLCENNDKFAIQRKLPKIAIDDILVIYDAGAHGHAMGFTYNGKMRSAEFLLTKKGTFKMIRRAETLKDHFATLEF